MILKLKRAPGIYLVGFMGCGKSTVGARLADEIGWRFLDLDHRIEEEQQKSIVSIFEEQGEQAFRQIESEAIQHLIKETYRGRATVAALGGGAFAWPGNRERLEDSGVTIWIDCPFERICSRIANEHHRPLAKDPIRFRELYETRREAYAKADYKIEFDSNDPTEAVQSILALRLLG
ncbi:shikimate kinase [Bryobacter aggregatus]|uniref:shikimate kinase n=1 Tax=Bryobacter aggregatus TaxID=360054 RepID=UPI0005662B80|nr:shikimate kinase [Bryobacter aggregatus]